MAFSSLVTFRGVKVVFRKVSFSGYTAWKIASRDVC